MHHSGVVMRESTVETATHLLAKAESPPYFSARTAVTPPMGMVLMASQLPLPGFLGRTVKSLSNCNMGVSMILIGAIIGSSRMGKLWDKDCFLYCLIRLGLSAPQSLHPGGGAAGLPVGGLRRAAAFPQGNCAGGVFYRAGCRLHGHAFDQ